MAPPLKLAAMRDFVEQKFKEGASQPRIVLALQCEKNIVCDERTLRRYCSRWGISWHKKSEDTPAVRLRIKELFHEMASDDKIIKVLEDEGFGTMRPRRLFQIRKEENMKRRLDTNR